MSHWSEQLPRDACREAREWASKQPSYAAAWRTCQRGDWMLWLIARLGCDRRKLTLTCCAVARQVLHLVQAGEDRPRLAIETAERWARREPGVTIGDVEKAADAAYAAAAAAYAAAAYAAADAAYAAAAAAYAAAAASSAANAAYTAAASLASSADIVRQRYPRAPRLRRKV